MAFQGGFERSEGCALLQGFRQGIPSFGGVAGKQISTFFGAKYRLDVIRRTASRVVMVNIFNVLEVSG